MTLFEQDIIRRLQALEKRQDDLEKRVGASTGLFRDPPVLDRPKTPACTRCGVALSGVMGYSCPHQNCPTGLGGVFSQIRTD